MKAPASIEEAEKKRKEDAEAKWDMIYMVTAVLLTVGVITFFMVGFIPFFNLLPDANSASSSLPGWLVLVLTLPITSSRNN
jgi:uncharacterized membrane protein